MVRKFRMDNPPSLGALQDRVLLPDLLENVPWSSPCKKFKYNPPEPATNNTNFQTSEEAPTVCASHNISQTRYSEPTAVNSVNHLCNTIDSILNHLPLASQDSKNPTASLVSKGQGWTCIAKDHIICESFQQNTIHGMDIPVMMSLNEALGPTTHVDSIISTLSKEPGYHWKESFGLFDTQDIPLQTSRYSNEKYCEPSYGGGALEYGRSGGQLCTRNEGYTNTSYRNKHFCGLAGVEQQQVIPFVSTNSNVIPCDANAVDANGLSKPEDESEGHSSESVSENIPAVVGARKVAIDCDCDSNQYGSMDGKSFPTMNASALQENKHYSHGWTTIGGDAATNGQIEWNKTLDCLNNILRQHESMVIDWENLDYKIRQFQWAMTELYQSKEVLQFKMETVSLQIHSTINSLKKFMNNQTQHNLPSSSSTTTTASSGLNARGGMFINNSENDPDTSGGEGSLCVHRYIPGEHSNNYYEDRYDEDSCPISNDYYDCKFDLKNDSAGSSSIRHVSFDGEGQSTCPLRVETTHRCHSNTCLEVYYASHQQGHLRHHSKHNDDRNCNIKRYNELRETAEENTLINEVEEEIAPNKENVLVNDNTAGMGAII